MGANVQCAWGVVSNELTTGASERSLGSGDAEVGRHQIGGRGVRKAMFVPRSWFMGNGEAGLPCWRKNATFPPQCW